MIDRQIFKKILVPVDGSHSCLHAKMFASSIAKKFKSKVTVVHVASHEFMHPELLQLLLEMPRKCSEKRKLMLMQD
ncbi:MAG: universal stress protein [Candidatus Bathyarchaeota archaeon]